MRISILTLGAIASVLTINAYAVSSTVTSQDYVDAKDALKQNVIPVAETNYDTPGVSVVTYTNTAGTIGERWICDAELDGDGKCMDNNLVTRDLLESATNNLPETTVTYKTCYEWTKNAAHTDANCILWNLSDQPVYGCLRENESCTSDSQCCSRICNNGYCLEFMIIPATN